MLQDIRYPYEGPVDAESLHKFSERVFDRLVKDHDVSSSPSVGRKFIFTLDPLQDQSTHKDMILRTDVFQSLVPGGKNVILPEEGNTQLLLGRISPTFKIRQAREEPIKTWLNKREGIQKAGNVVEIRDQPTSKRPRSKNPKDNPIPETVVFFNFEVVDCIAYYNLLRTGIGDSRAYGCGMLISL